MSRQTRRRFLQVSGLATAAALAGCTGTGDGSGGATETEATEEMTEGMSDDEMTDEGMDETESMSDGEMTDEGMDETVDVTVRIENVAPTDIYGPETHTGGEIWLTPGVFVRHTGTNPIHTPGEPASIGLEALAEAGPSTGFQGEPGLVDELTEMTGEMGVLVAGAYTPENTVADPNDPMGSVPGAPPIAPGGAFEFTMEARPGERLSVASMVVPSNDTYIATGTEGIALWPTDGEPVAGDVTDGVALFDAGTEPNGDPGFGPDQAPAQSNPKQGGDEDGVVRPLSAVDDGFSYPDVTDIVRVTLSPEGMDEMGG